MTGQDNNTDPNASGFSPSALLDAAYGTQIHVGPTARRPGFPADGESYYDTDIGLPIWWSNSRWCNALGMRV